MHFVQQENTKRHTVDQWLSAWRAGQFKIGLHMEGQERKEEEELALRIGFAEWLAVRSIYEVIAEIGHFLERVQNNKVLTDLKACTMTFYEGMMPVRNSTAKKAYTIINFNSLVNRPGYEKVVARVWLDGSVTSLSTSEYSYALRWTIGTTPADVGIDHYKDDKDDIYAKEFEEFIVRLMKAETGQAPTVVTIGDVAASQQMHREAALQADRAAIHQADREACEEALREMEPAEAEAVKNIDSHLNAMAVVKPGQIFSMGWYYDDEKHRYVLKALEAIDLPKLSKELRAGYPPGVTVGQHLAHLNKTILDRKLATTDYILEFCAPNGDHNSIDEEGELKSFLRPRCSHLEFQS